MDKNSKNYHDWLKKAGNDLVRLLNLCLRKDETLGFLKDDLEVLNQYYIESKYPLDMPIDYPKEEAREAINKAKAIFKAVKDRIG